MGYYYVNQFWTDESVYQGMLQNIYNAYHFGKTVELRKEFMPEGSMEKWEKILNLKIKGTQIEEKIIYLKNSSLAVNMKKQIIEKWLGISFDVVEGYLFGEMKEDGFNLRNNIDHLHFFYGKDGKSLLELYQRMFQRLKYDRKLQNNLIQRIEDILQRYHLRTKVVWYKSEDANKLCFRRPKPFVGKAKQKEGKQKDGKQKDGKKGTGNDGPIVSDVFTMKPKDKPGDKPFTAYARTKEFCQVVQKIGNYIKEGSSKVST